jgi:hypothetical protein
VTKSVLVNVASPHTIFKLFETFGEDESRNKLRVSATFMILRTTVQKLWVFEVSRQGMANQQEMTTSTKSGGQEKKNSKKNGQYNTV